jgi:hypothetical protein
VFCLCKCSDPIISPTPTPKPPRIPGYAGRTGVVVTAVQALLLARKESERHGLFKLHALTLHRLGHAEEVARPATVVVSPRSADQAERSARVVVRREDDVLGRVEEGGVVTDDVGGEAGEERVEVASCTGSFYLVCRNTVSAQARRG